MKRILPLWAIVILLGACTEPVPPNAPTVDHVSPLPLYAGAELTIEGHRFADRGHVAIGRHPLNVVRWSKTRIEAVAPPDLPAGQWVLTVVADGRPAAPFPVEVAGVQISSRDHGLTEALDGGLMIDAAGPSVPTINPRLQATFTADPGGNDEIRIRALPAMPGELLLEISGPNAWGVAFHLVYDPNLLALAQADPNGELTAYGALISPGRWAYGRRVAPSRGGQYVTLRFVLVGPGEGRLDFPLRHRTLRDDTNTSIVDVPWTAGSIRIQEAP